MAPTAAALAHFWVLFHFHHVIKCLEQHANWLVSNQGCCFIILEVWQLQDTSTQTASPTTHAAMKKKKRKTNQGGLRDYPQLHSTVGASTEIISPPNITLLF